MNLLIQDILYGCDWCLLSSRHIEHDMDFASQDTAKPPDANKISQYICENRAVAPYHRRQSVGDRARFVTLVSPSSRLKGELQGCYAEA
jgi:hypothetical protein